YERAAKYRDLSSTVEQLHEKQRIASAEGDDTDVFGYHYENGMLAVNLFHMRGGKVVDRREFFWEDLPEFAVPQEDLSARVSDVGDTSDITAPRLVTREFHTGEVFPALLKQLYIGHPHVLRVIYMPVQLDDSSASEELLSDQ